jgi:hypothetical protein
LISKVDREALGQTVFSKAAGMVDYTGNKFFGGLFREGRHGNIF